MQRSSNDDNSAAARVPGWLLTGPCMPAAVLMSILVSLTVACVQSGGAHGGAVVPASFEENVLYGGGICSGDDVCPGGICAGGTCVGYLMIPSDMARDIAGGRVRDAVAAKPDMGVRLAEAAARIVNDQTAETFGRARAADMFRFLPCGYAPDLLAPALESPIEAVRFYSARSLALCGDEAGTEKLRTFLEHDSEPVRLMAASALDAARPE